MDPVRTSARWLFLACAGIGTFYLSSQWAGSRHESSDDLDGLVVQAAPRRNLTVTPPTAAPRVSALDEALPGSDERARSIPAPKGELFAKLSWLPPSPPPPPPAPPPKPAPPAPPATPALPFTFVGMLERGATTPSAFVAKGDALLVISAGDMLENNTYRVESLSANEIVLTYLPMNIRQALSVTGRAK